MIGVPNDLAHSHVDFLTTNHMCGHFWDTNGKGMGFMGFYMEWDLWDNL